MPNTLRQVSAIGLGAALLAGSTPAAAASILALPNLQSISVYERTGGSAPTEHMFSVADPRILEQTVIGPASSDFVGAAEEFYDVFVSDADGLVNPLGSFFTVEGAFAYPSGGGFNIAEVKLNFSDGSSEFGSWVASYYAAGNGAAPSTYVNAADGDLLTHTSFGENVSQWYRQRVTIGFASATGIPNTPDPIHTPIPASGLLLGAALSGIPLFRRRKRC